MKTPAQLAEVLNAMVGSGSVSFKTKLNELSEIFHHLAISFDDQEFPVVFKIPLVSSGPSAMKFQVDYLTDAVNHLIRDPDAKRMIDQAIIQAGDNTAAGALLLKELLNTARALEPFQTGDLATPGSNVIEVYYHTRDAIEFHQSLYAQLTISPNEATISEMTRLGLYERAAIVVVPEGADSHNLEIAFEKTQNIDDSWTKNETVIALTDRPRSSMMGDVMVVNGKPFVVSMIGFKPLNEFYPFAVIKQDIRKTADAGELGL
jgi:hypothetical protein